MVTIVMQGTGGNSTTKTTIKADIGSTLEELNTKGYNTQFTAMDIESDDDSIIKGAEIRPQVYDWATLKAQAVDYSLTVTAIDFNAIAGGASNLSIDLTP